MNTDYVVSDSRQEAIVTRALQASEARCHELCENITDIVFTLNSDGDFTSMNRAGENISGYLREEVIGMNFADIVAAEYVREARAILAWQPQYGPAFQEIVILAKDGHRVNLRLRLSTIFDYGRPAGVQAIARTQTQLTETQEGSRQSEKMEVMGRLGAGMAHDFNNVLTAILGYGYLALERLEEGSPTHREVGEMMHAAQRAATLTGQMLGFSRTDINETKVLDLNEAVVGVDRMLRRLITEDIEIVTRLESGLDPVAADQAAIELAIMNVVLNARDAMPRGGILTLETSTINLESLAAASSLGLATGTYARLKITDTGCGMSPQTLSRAFEPFFTTKERGKGTGLGLPSAFAAVKQSNGQITVRSNPRQGTTFEIYLPTMNRVTQNSIADNQAIPVSGGCETVLVLDDEEMIRSVIHAYLRKSGYLVLEAASGPEAAQIAEHHGAPIHLLLTDVVMPHMSGPQSAERLSVIHPEMKVLYMSGHSRDVMISHGIGDSDSALLKKPFTPDILERKVREMLASPARTLQKHVAA